MPEKILKALWTSNIKSSLSTNKKFILNQSKTQKQDSENNGLTYFINERQNDNILV